MKQLEDEILRWFVTRLAEDDPVRKQLCNAEVSAREFTSGGGVFLTLKVAGLEPSDQGAEPTYIDGPEIRTPEMASGALVTLHLAGEVPSYLEIWSYANDYPIDRHPNDVALVEPQRANLIDLR
jgi:hypothetical protein